MSTSEVQGESLAKRWDRISFKPGGRERLIQAELEVLADKVTELQHEASTVVDARQELEMLRKRAENNAQTVKLLGDLLGPLGSRRSLQQIYKKIPFGGRRPGAPDPEEEARKAESHARDEQIFRQRLAFDMRAEGCPDQAAAVFRSAPKRGPRELEPPVKMTPEEIIALRTMRGWRR